MNETTGYVSGANAAPGMSGPLSDIVLDIQNLSKSYKKFPALRDVSFHIPKGQIVGLLGPNGSGKTTLIKIVNTLITDYTGEVYVCGYRPGVDSKKLVSYLPDLMYFPDWMRVCDCISMFSDFYEDFDAVKARSMCQSLNLDPSQRIKALSKGTQEKLQLLVVMSRRARLYLFDEPLAAVDPAARDYIMQTILTNYHEEGSILLSTHLIADVEPVLDHALFLKNGQIVLDDAVDHVRETTGGTLDQYFREVFKC